MGDGVGGVIKMNNIIGGFKKNEKHIKCMMLAMIPILSLLFLY